MSSKILVVGATGSVGSLVVSQLLAISPVPQIRVSSRDPAKLSMPASVEVVQADPSDPSTYPTLFNGIGKLFLYLSGLENSLQALLTSAKDAGVHHIVFLSSSTILLNSFYSGKIHANVEDAIKETGFTYTFLRCNNFSTNAIRMWAPQIKHMGSVSICCSNFLSAPVACEDIAEVAVIALTSSKLDNQVSYITGPQTLSFKDQLNILSEVRKEYQGKGVAYQEISTQTWRDNTAALKVLPEFMLDVLIELWSISDDINKVKDVSQDVERITGHPAMSFKEWAKVHVKELF